MSSSAAARVVVGSEVKVAVVAADVFTGAGVRAGLAEFELVAEPSEADVVVVVPDGMSTQELSEVTAAVSGRCVWLPLVPTAVLVDLASGLDVLGMQSRSQPERLADRVRSVAAGEMAWDQASCAVRSRPRSARLTPREREVLAEKARGGTDKDVARKLCISPATTSGHLRAVREKFGVATSAAAIRAAVNAGELSPDGFAV